MTMQRRSIYVRMLIDDLIILVLSLKYSKMKISYQCDSLQASPGHQQSHPWCDNVEETTSMDKRIPVFQEKNSDYLRHISLVTVDGAFMFLQVICRCQGVNDYGKISIHIISH